MEHPSSPFAHLASPHLLIKNVSVVPKNNNLISSNHVVVSELKELPQNGKKRLPVIIDPYDACFDGEYGKIFSDDAQDEKIDGLIWNSRDCSVTLVNQSLRQIPAQLTAQYASLVRKLDLSYNCLQTLSGIEYFNCLEELILDNNLLDDTTRFFYNPFLQILSINKNKLTDLERFLNEVTLKLPCLTYLSMLGNSACPDQLSSSEHDDDDYNRYRSYVIHRMPQLKFLDSTPVNAQERTEAKQRGQYCRLIRLNSDSVVETNRNRNHLFTFREDHETSSSNNYNNNNCNNANRNSSKHQITPLPHNSTDSTPKGAFGRLKHRYTGKHSEGNRFIRNHEL